MTPRLLRTILIAVTCGLLLSFVIPAPADAACKAVRRLCQQGECENMCITTSDGAGQPYIDDRKRAARQRMYQHYRAERSAAQRRDPAPWEGTNYDTAQGRAQRQQEGRNRWRDDGQVVQGLPGKISPFVPGSTQDLAWKEERRRRGVQ